MVEFHLKINREQRVTYVPQEVVRSLGYELILIPNSKSAVIFSKGTNLKRVLQSLAVIMSDIRLQTQDEENTQKISEAGMKDSPQQHTTTAREQTAEVKSETAQLAPRQMGRTGE